MLPKIKTALPGPKAKKIIERDSKVLSKSLGRVYPLVVEKTYEVNYEDPDGNVFLDFNSGIAVANFGWNNRKILTAIREQLGKVTHGALLEYYMEPAVKFSEDFLKFAQSVNPSLARVFLSNSGTEAIECAMKAARHFTKRKYFLSFTGSFHGRTMGALSLTEGKPVYKHEFGPFLESVHVPYPNPYRCPFGNTIDHDCSEEVLRHIEDVIFKKEIDTENCAALFAEPILGEGGYIVPPEGFLKDLQKLCQKHGILFVADEVQSGCFRTGKFAASEWFGIKSDVMCFAKAIGGGLPMGVTVARDDIFSEWPPGSHASTFGGNGASCAAGLAVLDIMKNKKLGPDVIRKGDYIQKFMKDLQRESRCLGDVRGKGLMIGLEFVKNKHTKEPYTELRDKIIYKCFEKGLSLLPAAQSVIRIAPPLIIEKHEIDAGLEIFRNVLKEVERESK